MGSLNHGGCCKGESRTLHLICTIWKLIGGRGFEKSGKMVTFATYLKNNFEISEILLYSFLGNSFNIIFLNGPTL